MSGKLKLTARQIWLAIAIPMILLQILIVSVITGIYFTRPCGTFTFSSLADFEKACPQVVLPSEQFTDAWGSAKCTVTATNSTRAKLKNSYQDGAGGAEKASISFDGVSFHWIGYTANIRANDAMTWEKKESYEYKGRTVWCFEGKRTYSDSGKEISYRFAENKSVYILSTDRSDLDIKAAIESLIDRL